MSSPPQTKPDYRGDISPQQEGSEVAFRRIGLQPPSRVYIDITSQLWIRLFNSVANQTVVLKARTLRPDGVIQRTRFAFLPTSDRLANDFQITVAEGYLLSVTLGVQASSTLRGQTYCNLALAYNTPGEFGHHEILFNGYLTRQIVEGWPVGDLALPVSGQGALLTITGSTPSAGAEIAEAVPSNAIWRVKSFLAKLTTGAAAGTRTPTLQVKNGGTVVFALAASSGPGPSSSSTFILGPGLDLGTDGASTFTIPLPDNLWLDDNYTINTLTTGIAAADQWSAPTLITEELISTNT